MSGIVFDPIHQVAKLGTVHIAPHAMANNGELRRRSGSQELGNRMAAGLLRWPGRGSSNRLWNIGRTSACAFLDQMGFDAVYGSRAGSKERHSLATRERRE